ncbi:MAG: hypothetical protein MJ198_04170 [Bacteroidales bacterium]|nr:hypothetical protein [Bacteroidales bacterium]
MKKSVILALGALFLGNIAFSQSDEFQLTWGIVETDAKKSDAEIANPKKASKITVWTERGRRYLQVYNFDAENIYPGTTKEQIPLIMKCSAKSEQTVGDTTIQSFDRIDFYIVNGKVAKYTRTGRAKDNFFPTHSAALDVATEAYLKANELNLDGKKTKVISEQLKALADLYQKEALFPYYSKDYKTAAVYYTKAGNIVKTGLTGDVDSVRIAVLKNCGEINKAAGNYDQAISFYNDINAISASTEMYANIYYCQLMQKDTTSAVNTLLKVLNDFPNDPKVSDYLNQLIDMYIKTNQLENATAYLQKAIEADPNNTAYIFNLGYLNETMNNRDAAIENYKKAIAIDANEPNSNFNYGRLLAENGNAVMKEAEKLWGKKGYQAKVDEGKKILKQSCDCFEICAENTQDKNLKKNAYYNLMKLYAQIGLMDKSKASREKYNEL